MASDEPPQLPTGGMQLTLGTPPGGAVAVPGPDKIVTGSVTVPESALDSVQRVEVQYRGVEVVGGTLDDYEDGSFDGLALRKGARALNRLYFDERLVLWRRDAEAGPPPGPLPFSIAYPNANYPSEVRSASASAPSQSFEIAYHIIVWLVGANNAPVARLVQSMPFVPAYSRKPGPVVPPQAPASQTGYDDRGKECLVTRVTLSQPDYIPGDQVVAGVYIECTKSSRSIRKAECTLRQRVECRMRRTFGPTETAEIVSNSRPQSSQPSAASDDSDVLWSRMIDVGPSQNLTLTTSGVGLAAAAAAGGSSSASASPAQASVAASSVSQASELCETSDKRDSTISRTLASRSPSLIAGMRLCSASMHTSIPASASMISGHFLLFSYELHIDVTIGSLARGGQKICTRTPLGLSIAEPHTPTSASGFTLANLQPQCHRALAEAHASSGLFSAAAACFPQHSLNAPASLAEGRDAAGLRKSRFSAGAFQPGAASGIHSDRAAEDAADDAISRRFSALKSAPPGRSSFAPSVSEGHSTELPNAVEHLRYRCTASQVLVPKIFDPSKPAVQDTQNKSPVSDKADAAEEQPAAIPEGPPSPSSAKAFIGTAKSNEPDKAEGEQEGASLGSSRASAEYDLARAVYAAAEKVVNDKEWERPDSYLLAKSPKRKSKGARPAVRSTHVSGANAGVAATTGASADKPDFDAEAGSTSSSRTSSHYSDMDQDEIEQAINRLAPQKQAPTSRGSTQRGVKDIITGIDFFEAADSGPELTGLLSADPTKLTFGTTIGESLAADPEGPSPEEPAPAASSAAATYSPASNGGASVQPGWTMFTPEGAQPQPISTALRRSISMPENAGSSGTGSSELAQPSTTFSQKSAEARSAIETGEYKNVLVRKSRMGRLDASRLSGMSPTSMISAMSSTSRLGTTRASMLRNIGQRVSSWFSKK
ncbi:hypothetical protein GGF46_004548 [Coemansia sp. RSA 552]|nr:hypothetical protein GGF46_004548 [Coemansia sp. RSA 552]